MDLTTVFDLESPYIGEQIMQPLFTVRTNGAGVEPWLATSYSVAPNDLTWTIHLRPGVRFSNGRAMTSADVKFSLDQARAATAGWGYLDTAIKSVQAPNASTIVLTTSVPWAPLLADLAHFVNSIVPDGYGGQTKAEFYQHPVGTGPFKWDYWHKGSALKLVRNPLYWQPGKPYLDSVTWITTSDDSSRTLQLKGGQAQIDQFPPWSSIASLQANTAVKVSLFPSTGITYVLMNEHLKPFQDVHVRRAISYALNYQGMIHAVLFGNGQRANSFLMPTIPYYDQGLAGLQYNPAKARQEMQASAFPQGFSTTLLTASGQTTQTELAQIIQQELKPLGINVSIKLVSYTDQFPEEQKFNYGLGFTYWSMDIADPDEFVSYAVTPNTGANSNATAYSNPAVTRWTVAAEKTLDPATRQALYYKIQSQVANDSPFALLYYAPNAYAYAKSVHGFFVTPFGNYHLEDVWLGG
jgi:peptide/nickel transport system substrate-binding protein